MKLLATQSFNRLVLSIRRRPGAIRYRLWSEANRLRRRRRESLAFLVARGGVTVVLRNLPGETDDESESWDSDLALAIANSED